MSPWKQRNLARLMIYGFLCLAIGSYVYFGWGQWIDTSVDTLFDWRSSAVDAARGYRDVD